MKKILTGLLILPLLFLLSACDDLTKDYTVTFADEDGRVLNVITPEGVVELPSEPEKVGFVFDGWYTDLEYLDLYDEFDLADVLVGDLIVYAKWSPATFKVTVNFGTGFDPVEVDYTYGEEFVMDNPPIKKGYEVGEYFVDSLLEQQFDPLNPPSANFELYATWAPKTITVNYYEKVQFDVNFFSIGPYTTHIVTTANEVFGWGYNAFGTIGIESDEFDNLEDEPINITEFFNLSVGETITQLVESRHTIALSSNNRVFVWGESTYKQLGYEDQGFVFQPLEVTSELPLDDGDFVVSVSVGNRHSVLLTNTGRLIMCGNDDEGQLGNGDMDGFSIFTEITDLIPLLDGEVIVEAYAYGNSTLLYTSDNRILVTGENDKGQLGTGDFLNKQEFTDITSMFGLESSETCTRFAFGYNHVLVLTSSGNVFTFGNNGSSQLGDGTSTNKNVPTVVMDNGIDIFVGGLASYVFDEDLDLYGFGDIPNDFYLFAQYDSVLDKPTLISSEFRRGIFLEFAVGHDTVWGKLDNNEWIGFGSPQRGQLIDFENITELNRHFESSFSLTHSEEAIYGEEVELYFPESTLYQELTKWFIDEEQTHRFFDESRLAYEELNLYGDWEQRTFKLTIVENSVVEPYIQVYGYDDFLNLHAVKDGYQLEGWYLDEELTIPFELEKMPGFDFTIYAKWEEKVPVAITIPYESGELTQPGETLYEFTVDADGHLVLFASLEYGTVIRLLDGNRLQIALYDPSEEGRDNIPREIAMSEMLEAGTYYISIQNKYSLPYEFDVLLLEYFIPELHTITFDNNGGKGIEELQLFGGEVLDMGNPYYSAHSFVGWYQDAELTIPFDYLLMPNEDITIYAKWEEIITTEITLTGHLYTGILIDGDGVLFTFTLMETTSITLYTESSMDTYGTLYDDNNNVISSNDDYQGADFRITQTLSPGTYYVSVRGFSGNENGEFGLYFEEVVEGDNTRTVTFDSNGGTVVDSIVVIEDEIFEWHLPLRDGYVFDTWCIDAELTIRFDMFDMPLEDFTLYARWAETEELQIADVPITRTVVDMEIETISGYEFTLTETTTLDFSYDAPYDHLGVVLEANEDGFMYVVDIQFLEANDVNITELELEPGTYFIVIINLGGEPGDYTLTIN